MNCQDIERRLSALETQHKPKRNIAWFVGCEQVPVIDESVHTLIVFEFSD